MRACFHEETAVPGCPAGVARTFCSWLEVGKEAAVTRSKTSRFPPGPLSFHARGSPPQSPAPAPAHAGHLPAEPPEQIASAPHAEKTSAPHAAVPLKPPEVSS